MHLFQGSHAGSVSVHISLQCLGTVGLSPGMALLLLDDLLVRLTPPQGLVIGGVQCLLQLGCVLCRLLNCKSQRLNHDDLQDADS